MCEVPSTSPDSPTVEGFLKTVLKSRLLDREQLQEALRDVPKAQRDDANALADHLIRKGKLSRFQAKKLLSGSGKGLLLDHYQVLAPIGRGGMSTVYLARDERTDEVKQVFGKAELVQVVNASRFGFHTRTYFVYRVGE